MRGISATLPEIGAGTELDASAWGPKTGLGSEQSMQSVCEAVWRMEQELGLLDRSVDGIFYWPVIRPKVVHLLGRKAGIIEARGGLPNSIAGRTGRHIAGLLADLRHHPWSASGPLETVLVAHDRKVLSDGELVDTNSNFVLRDLAAGRVLVLDASERGYYAEQPGRVVRGRRIISALAQICGRLSAAGLRPKLATEHERICALAVASLGMPFPLSLHEMASDIAIFRAGRRLVRSVLANASAKQLFIVNANGSPAYVAAARDLGIPAIEIQHGAISRYHMGYSYPGRPQVHYAPDIFLTFGPYWNETVDLPGNTQTFVMGHRRLSRNSERAPRTVLVLSQSHVGERLFSLAVSAAALSPAWQFVFRPHPDESASYYKARLAGMELRQSNFAVAEPGGSLEQALSSAEVQVGVYSTALFEGMAAGARTVIVNLPGAENVREVIGRGEAVLAESPAEIAAQLDKAPVCHQCQRYFANSAASLGDVLALAEQYRSP